ncbi:hypothetical protein [Hydrogenophaga sp.]|nr:hypothetical protein [Hydrogenophaga sp.]
MAGLSGTEEGQTDAVFTFNKSNARAYSWGQPIRDGSIDLSNIEL